MPDPDIDPPPPDDLRHALVAWWTALPSNFRGGLIYLIAAVQFCCMIVLIKLAGERLHVTEILFFRQMVMMLLVLPAIIRGWPESIHTARPDLQGIRIFLAFFGMTFGFGAFIHLPLAEATVIGFSKTFFTTILAIFLLGEVVRLPRWTALIAGFVGVMIIVWPEEDVGVDFWQLVALGSAIAVSGVMIVIRILSQIDRPVTILTYQALGVGILMIPPTLYFWITPTAEEWMLLIAIGVISASAQYTNIFAFRAGEASLLAPLEYTRLIILTAFGWWIFSEWPEPRVWVGASIIITAALFMMYRERIAGRKKKPDTAG